MWCSKITAYTKTEGGRDRIKKEGRGGEQWDQLGAAVKRSAQPTAA